VNRVFASMEMRYRTVIEPARLGRLDLRVGSKATAGWPWFTNVRFGSKADSGCEHRFGHTPPKMERAAWAALKAN
jgi:hypothetical protein